MNGNVRNISLNIVDNGVNSILVSMLKPYKYVLFSSLQIMSVIHKYSVIYLIKFHQMNELIPSILMELMTRNTVDK